MRATHTYAVLDVSAAAYDEIAAKLREAGYEHAFLPERTEIEGLQSERGALIDMHGIAIARLDAPTLPPLGDGHHGDGDYCPENASGDFRHSYYWSDALIGYQCRCGARLLDSAKVRR